MPSISFDTVKSPFERMVQIDALAMLTQSKAPSKAKTSKEKFSAGEALCTHSNLRGLIGSARSLAIGAVAQLRAHGFDPKKPKPSTPTAVVLAVVPGPEEAEDLLGDLRAFRQAEETKPSSPTPPPDSIEKLPSDLSAPPTIESLPLEAMIFPAWDVLPTESERPEGAALAGRQRVQDYLQSIRATPTTHPHTDHGLIDPSELPRALIVIAPIVALLQPCDPPEQEGNRLVLKTGATHEPIQLGRTLANIGFDRTGQVEVKGEYALRGGILDIFPYASETPYRLDFFDDEIESIAPFDPITQRSSAPIDSIAIADASIGRLRKLFAPKSKRRDGRGSLVDHLPSNSLVVWVNPTHAAKRASLFEESLISGKSACIKLAKLRPYANKRFDTLTLLPHAIEEDTFLKEEDELPSAKPNKDFEEPSMDSTQTIKCTSLQRLQGEVHEHAMEWKKLAASRTALYVFCQSAGERKRLEGEFQKENILPAPSIHFINGNLSGGFDLRSLGMAALTDREIFQRRKHARPSSASRKHKIPANARPLASIFELQCGDYVVHAMHGIARYQGISQLEKSGRMEDYLTLLYQDDVKLYVPAPQIHLVSKFIGGTAHLQLSKIGGKAWARKKARAEKAIKDIADDLLKVQSIRQSLPGIVYPPDDDLQHSFESTFLYQETDDQINAIAAVKNDMESTYPMDRLICGDVGFGKTEVAIRAAFKAVNAGRQFGVLVPTTLLCEQHGRTFKERFAGFPIRIETLSRFKSKKEQRQVLDQLAEGKIDGVIGTHRVIQKDVKFKNLGLAIIDEEQRFGVEHKEFFKQLRKSIDLLTLTATPIPRTLHMSLLGLRDISNLTTAPQNRKSIITKVARINEDLVRRAILRELSRGGQCFFVHPRVMDIQELRSWLADLVPEARFNVGHGQMSAEKLETVMGNFLGGKMDVLVSTTIVESGLDIPRANTILIHEADHFGLAELHQLRGRVGRSDIQAYCYMLLPKNRSITPDGLKRLRALEEYDELGAGFQIALKDLEIRGAGNVLGGEQSGWIAEIGYDLYCKLLDATVRSLKGEPIRKEIFEVTLHLRKAAYLPDSYFNDEKAILECYRRLEKSEDQKQIATLRTEMEERFGSLPEEAHRIFEEHYLRLLAVAAHIPYIGFDKEEQRLIFKFHKWDMKAIDRAIRGMPEARNVRILNEQTLSFGLTLKAKNNESALRKQVQYLLEELAKQRKNFGSTVKK